MTKSELYSLVDKMKRGDNLNKFSIPYDAKSICVEGMGLFLDDIPIRSHGLRGMSHIPTKTVVIDNNISDKEQNFFCMHEVMHHCLHKDRRVELFKGYESIQPNQDPFIEWQANEGAAQFLVPYQRFIPEYVSLSREYAYNLFPAEDVVEALSDRYFVTEGVIRNRISNLNCEIYQYMWSGNTFTKNFRILSKSYLTERGWRRSHAKAYCANCLSPVGKKFKYCKICGASLYREAMPHRFGLVSEGAGYMIYKYDKIDLDESEKAKVCPVCENEEIETGEYCKICGNGLVNRCSDGPDNGRSVYCGIQLTGNARFCHQCGERSTFFQNNILDDWETAKRKIEAKAQNTNNFSELDDYSSDEPLPF